jgi:protein-S-isoprenylcysteine O-methyltransferase Ste14
MKRYQLENILPLLCTLLTIFVCVHYAQTTIAFILGSSLSFIGLLLWWMGKMTLGDAFTALPNAKKLVTKGIYATLRHPIYTGISVLLAGYILIIDTLLIRVIAVLCILSFLIRIFFEEKKLREKFGKKYEKYRKKTLF